MNGLPAPGVTWDWEQAPSVALPEHRATWARIEIRVGDDLVTRVEDRETQSSRRAIYCPLYPVAEWIAFNWWLLRANTREAGRFALRAGESRPVRGPGAVDRRHRLRSAGDGFLWPDLAIIPEGSHTRLVWRSDGSSSEERPVRFLSEGDRLVDSAALAGVFAAVVAGVLERLRDQGLPDTGLAKEWSAVQDADEDEAAYCLAAAGLGLDPTPTPTRTRRRSCGPPVSWTGRCCRTFWMASPPDGSPKAWTGSGMHSSSPRRDSRQVPRDCSACRSIPGPGGRTTGRGSPGGVRHAPCDRRSRSMPPSGSSRRTTSMGSTAAAPTPGCTPSAGPVTGGSWCWAGSRGPTGERFTLSRSLWHLLGAAGPEYLVTAAYTDRQKVERAFAAELLAPAAGIAAQLGDGLADVSTEDLDRVADHFAVSAILVEHQVANQLLV